MQVLNPTAVKFDQPLKEALKNFADKKKGGNVSLVIREAVMKYIKYNPVKEEKPEA